MRPRLACAPLLLALGCGAESAPPADPGGPPPPPAHTPVEAADETWCSPIQVDAELKVDAGKVVEVCAGGLITLSAGAKLVVEGTLLLSGTAADPVKIGGSGWDQIEVIGRVTGQHVEISGGRTCLQGAAGSIIELSDARLLACGSGFRLANGAVFERAQVLGGGQVRISGGVLHMSDSVIDLMHPTSAPDCTAWTGGGANLDHVRITGCHCPIHVNKADEGFYATHSIFDGAAVPIMVANAHMTVEHSHIIGGTELMDIGGGFVAEVAGNYYGGEAPNVAGDRDAFQGADDFSSTPFDDVGPR